MNAVATGVTGAPRAVRGLLGRARRALPRGNTLPAAVWARRHRTLLALVWLHAVGLFIYAVIQGYGVPHGLLEGGVVAAFAATASFVKRDRRVASALVSLGLVTASAVLVHLSGGVIEAHFHFFVIIILLTLYEDWVPVLLAAAYVLAHHGLMGSIDPGSVYNHPDAIAHPWKWASIHALFVTAAGLAAVAAWRLNEDYRAETQDAYRQARESELSLAEAQQLARLGSFEWELASGRVTWSDELYRVFGLTPGEFEPTYERYIARVHPEDRERVVADIERAVEERATFSHQYRCLRPDGATRTFHARGELVFGENGEPERMVGTCQDITERQRAEAQAVQRAAEQAAVAELGERALTGVEVSILVRDAVVTVARVLSVDMAGLLELTPDGSELVVLAGEGIPEEAAGAHVPAGRRSQAGYSLLMGEPVIVSDWEEETRFEKSEILTAAGVRSGVTVMVKGREKPFGVLGAQSRERREFDNDDINFLQSIANVLAAAIERRATEEEIRHQALHDPLTGLPNRNLFADRLTQALAHSRRHRSSVGVLFCDLDQFKLVNDSLGHEAGDELLSAVTPRIGSVLRAGDTVARFGGDEFGILIEDIESERDATRAAERIAAALSRPFVLRGREHFVTATIGIAIGDGSEPPEVLIRDADSAMYRAKEQGRGRYEIFDEVMRARAVEHLRIENDLRGALERDELTLHYQPVVSVASGAIDSVEALVRWQHPERGMMLPGAFIPLAEETGLIVPMGDWVLEEACRQAAAWHSERPDAAPIRISVNLSARQLGDPALPERVTRVLRETGIEPASLSLEITESALVDDSDASSATLGRLRELGVGLVLDDFGTGFSSLGYLKRFPFASLKVDRSFIDQLHAESADAAIVRAVASIADALGLSVVAEGVETAEQLEAIRALGCQYAQGYYFTRPLPAEGMGALLSRASDPLKTTALP